MFAKGGAGHGFADDNRGFVEFEGEAGGEAIAGSGNLNVVKGGAADHLGHEFEHGDERLCGRGGDDGCGLGACLHSQNAAKTGERVVDGLGTQALTAAAQEFHGEVGDAGFVPGVVRRARAQTQAQGEERHRAVARHRNGQAVVQDAVDKGWQAHAAKGVERGQGVEKLGGRFTGGVVGGFVEIVRRFFAVDSARRDARFGR